MYPNRNRLLLGVAVFALLLLPVTSFAAEEPVVVKNYGDAILFVPQVEAEDMTLTVTGPCNYKIRRSLREDGELLFKLDETTIDGIYRFEVTVIPSIDGSILDVLQDARKTGDNSKVDELCREGALPGDPLIQTAGFRVANAKVLYDPEKVEDFGGTVPKFGDQDVPSLNKDFVIIDDLIVDGSACIGFDCVNGESFGFDTLRLKENNLRIKFDDTSTAASFPRNDWQLTANDSANGGASKFSIDDISGSRTPFTVEANARSHSLYVDDGGRIGSRTSTPSVEIHTIDGDTPTLRLQQDGSSGFAPQTWDVAGNETNFFIRDVTNGSQLPFRIRPDSPTNSIFVDTDGSVGMGTASPEDALHVFDATEGTNIRIESGTSGAGFRLKGNGHESQILMASNGNLRIRGLTGSGEITLDTNTGFVGINDTTPSGTLDVNGTIFLSGAQIHPDFVFEPTYDLLSIEENSAFMWENKHLPSLAPAKYDDDGKRVIELGANTAGILEELEKAHLYIEQLNDKLKSEAASNAELAARLERLEQLLEQN